MRLVRRTGTRTLSLLAAALLSAVAAPAAAQLPSASARALGMADNYTALARGYTAVSWNPANLALPGGPPWSLAILPVRGIGGLDPVTTSELAEWEDRFVPEEVRRDWLRQIRDEGGQQGSGGTEFTALALSVGRFGVQVGTVARGRMSISPDVAELLLFGNAGLTGEPTRTFTGAESSMDIFAATTGALSYAHPIGLGAGVHAAAGVTAKYTVGHFVLHGEDAGSVLESDPLRGQVEFPVVHTDSVSTGNSGSGFGLDLALAVQRDAWSLGVNVQNVVNTFEWDRSDLAWRSGRAYFDADSAASDIAAAPIATAPAGATAFLDDAFEPLLAVGIAYRASPALTVSGDVRHRFGDGIELGPGTHAGAGIEYRALPVLPLRAGAAYVTDGYQLSAGAGLELGAFSLTAAAARRSTDLGTDVIGMLALALGPGL